MQSWYLPAMPSPAASSILRGPFRIDLGLRRQRDVVYYVAVTTAAAMASTATGVVCLVGDHSIRWSEFWTAAASWFLGDEIGLLGIAPFLLIHIFPLIRKELFPENQARSQQMSGRFWKLPPNSRQWSRCCG
jgi:integral membrane sensor domain MASE1